jgi:sterol desaturase/sphingolipid hydroxylase (fatty acid hydroxylase superfamily)
MFDALINAFVDQFSLVQQNVFEAAVQPALFQMGLGNLLEDGFVATGWFLVGVLQLGVMLLVLWPLERLRPVETVRDRAAVWVDVLYTLIHRLGLFRVVLFFSIDPLWDMFFAQWHQWGIQPWHLDAWLAPLLPGWTDTAFFAFLAYLLVFDFVDYWIHRGQHQFHWWWALHALHHSQRQMTMWSDNRNHLLDDLLRDSLLVLVAHLIGVPPGQFVAVVAITQLVESLSHANVRLWFGPVLERLLVSPRFHRLHHSIGLGHESKGVGTLGGHNFAVLFPIWDVFFRTANFEVRYDPTGIRDQLAEAGQRDYGRGFWAQQWLGVARLLRREQG